MPIMVKSLCGCYKIHFLGKKKVVFQSGTNCEINISKFSAVMFQLVFFIRQHLFLENKLIKRLLLLHKYMNYQILYVSHMLKKKK